MAVTKEQKLVNRSQRVAFMNTDTTGGTAKFERMTVYVYDECKESERVFKAVCR